MKFEIVTKTSPLLDNVFFALIIIVIGGILLGIYLFVELTYPKLSNSLTLVVEIGVGVIIALIIYRLSKKSEIKLETTLKQITDIVKEEAEFTKGRKIGYQSDVRRRIQRILSDVEDIETGNIRYESKTIEKRTKRIETDCNFTKGDVKKIRNIL